DDGPGDADGVAFLERVQADRMGGHLAGDDHHRDAVHVGRGDAGHRIGDTGTRGDHGDAHFAGGARITVSGVNGGLFVAHQHVLDGVLLVERVVDVQYRAAGIAPDELDVLGLEGLDQDFGAAEVLRGDALGGGSGAELRAGDFHDEPFGI